MKKCETCINFYECDNIGNYEGCLPEMKYYELNFHNRVQRILMSGNNLCFVIHTKDDKDYWYWQISKSTWEKFWKVRNPAYCDNITEEAANEFVNSEECSHCGDSCGNYASVEEAVAEYLRIKTN